MLTQTDPDKDIEEEKMQRILHMGMAGAYFHWKNITLEWNMNWRGG